MKMETDADGLVAIVLDRPWGKHKEGAQRRVDPVRAQAMINSGGAHLPSADDNDEPDVPSPRRRKSTKRSG